MGDLIVGLGAVGRGEPGRGGTRAARVGRSRDEFEQVQGDIFNKTGKEISVPPLKATLQDDSGKPLFDWTFSVDRPTIRPGETISFKTEAKNPPANASKLMITFTGGS